LYGATLAGPKASSAWIASGVRYRDRPSADPPNRTLAHLSGGDVIVWAVIYEPADDAPRPIRLDLSRAKRYACCEGADVAGGEYELTGTGPGRGYSVIVRIYFGSHPTRRSRARAQRALRQLQLPALR
jgi:hypothetical protein